MRRRPASQRPVPGLLAEAWQRYRDEILAPAPAGALQIRETRRAFYAGAMVVWTACFCIGQPDISEDDGARVLEGLAEELRIYKESDGTAEEMLAR